MPQHGLILYRPHSEAPSLVVRKANTPVMLDIAARKPIWFERGGAQNYRVKRLSACGGCLGDYRR